LGTGVRASNADIKCGNYFGRIDHPHNLGRAVIHRLGSLSGEPVLGLTKRAQGSQRPARAKRPRVAHIDAPTPVLAVTGLSSQKCDEADDFSAAQTGQRAKNTQAHGLPGSSHTMPNHASQSWREVGASCKTQLQFLLRAVESVTLAIP
jgi:hypothetical protein